MPIERHSLTWWLFLGFIDAGKFAVALFFMVSGFLIPATLRRPGATVAEFAVHRFLRLYPAYWLSILLALGAWHLLGRLDQLNAAILAANVTLFQRFMCRQDLVGVYWTLQIELVFYIICGALAAAGLLWRTGLLIVCALALASAVAIGRQWSGVQLPVALPIALALMFLGDRLRLQGEPLGSRRLLSELGATGVALIPICSIAYGGEGPRYIPSYWIAIGLFITCWRYAEAFAAFRWVERAAVFLGDISYGVHLMGATIMSVLAAPVYLATGSKALSAAAVVAETLLLSAAVFRYVQSPGIRLGRVLEARLRAQAVPVVLPERVSKVG
jgi:peptidoglycan/LPS O-acetylase OafA/YrhL